MSGGLPQGDGRPPIRAAIVGLGAVAVGVPPSDEDVTGPEMPSSHAAALAMIPGIEVVAGCDIVVGARARFNDVWGGTWPALRLYTNHHELLKRERPDLLTVATPDHLHGEIIIDAIEAGVRAIFAEKPLVTDVAEADRIVALAEQTGTFLQVDYTRRFRPEFLAAKLELTSGSIGELTEIVIRNGGGRAMLFRNTSHFVDLACFYAASDPDWVIAEFETGFEDYGTGYGGDGGSNPAREPGSNMYIAFDGGIRAYISDRKAAFRDQSLLLIGTSGSIALSRTGLVVTTQGEQGPVERRVSPRGTVGGIRAGIQDLIRASTTDVELASPAVEARKSVAIIDAALASQAQHNRRIEVAPVPIRPQRRAIEVQVTG